MAKEKRPLYYLWKHIRPNRKYRDRLFQKIFQDKEDLLELYNAVNHTSYQNPDELEITTLEDVIYLSMKNDLSFIVASSLNLYEHQSTYNPNMPIRGLLYFARLYEAYIEKHDLNIYGKKRISLPSPHYIVFYNGKENLPDESVLKLSDAFLPARGLDLPSEPVLECIVKMYNINPGHNKNLLKNCTRLNHYSRFITEINHRLESGMDLKSAVYTAIDTCISENILTDILSKNRSEVFHMLLTRYDEKKFLKFTYQEGVEDGLAEGLAEGLERVNHLNRLLLEQNRTEDMIKAANDSSYQQKLFEEFHI